MAEETASAKAIEDDDKPDLTDILYGQLQIPEIQVNQTFTLLILHEILPALVQSGIMTRQQVFDALDRFEQEVAETCAEVGAKNTNEHSVKVLQRMLDRAKTAAGRLRDKFTEPS